MTWHYLDSGPSGATMNMAIDEVLLHKMKDDDAIPILRFYRWSRPAVTIGYFQDVLNDFDLRGFEKQGWTFVRRLTGGRAVFHDQELTYSVVLPHASPAAAGGVLDSYNRLSKGLLIGLRGIGVDAQLVSSRREKGGAKRSRSRSANCFASFSWYEIQVGGKKLVGSAQRRTPYGILQQGSILLSTEGFRCFSEVLRKNARQDKTARGPVPGHRMTSIEEVLKKPVDLNQLKESILSGFRDAHGIRFAEIQLADEDERAARCLVKSRYGRSEWNLSRKQ